MSTTVVEPKAVVETLPPPPFEGDDVKPPAKSAEKPKDKDDPGELRRRLEASEQRIRELSDSERYWAEQARGRGTVTEEPDEDEPAPVDEEPEETPDEFLDRLSKEGKGAIVKAVAKLGYLRKEDVAKVAAEVARGIVSNERGKLTADAKLVSQYPELRDEKSELFQTTAGIYRELIADNPELKTSPGTLFMAARAAKAELAAKPKPARGGNDDEPRDYREDREEDSRRRRIDAQQGDTGRGRSTPYEGDDDPIGPAQRDVLDLFAKAGVDEKSYRDQRSRDRRRR